MHIAVQLVMAAISLLSLSVSCYAQETEDRLVVEVGEQEELLASGQDGVFCCPDLPLCVLEKRPLRVLMIGTEGTYLFRGKDWRSLRPEKLVLEPDKSSKWDNGYAGICGIYKKGSQVIALFHGEDHEGKTSGLAESKQANYAAYFSLGIAVSNDGGESFGRKSLTCPP